MIKKAGILVLTVCLLAAVLSPGLAQAQGGLMVMSNSAQVVFPWQLSFSLSVESDVDITDIRLCYTIDRIGFAQVVSEAYVSFTPATEVDVTWALDMVKIGGLPPGSGIEYWWLAEDASGDGVATAPTRVQFDDNRYDWLSLAEGDVTVYWYSGGESFAQEIMLTVQQALARLSEDTGAYLSRPVKLYVYTSSQDLRGAMIYPYEWTGGVAFTRYGIIAIGIAPNNLEWGKGAVAHELTHLVIHQMTFNPYNDLPTWLDEGLAMRNEGELGSELVSYLNNAIANGNLISVRSLASPFSAYTEKSYLSYAQSHSLVEFLTTSYGHGKMLELLNVFRQGSDYDEALEVVYGFDMDDLDALWQDYVDASTKTTKSGVTSTAFVEGWMWRHPCGI